MNTHTIPWNTVSKYSQALAIVLFVGVFVLGFFLGKEYELRAVQNSFAKFLSEPQTTQHTPVTVEYLCDGRPLTAKYGEGKANLSLPDKREFTLSQTDATKTSVYTSTDGSIVFERSDSKAKLLENGAVLLQNCAVKPSLQ